MHIELKTIKEPIKIFQMGRRVQGSAETIKKFGFGS